MAATKNQWTDPKRQSDLLEALLTVANLPSAFNPEQREAVIAMMHDRGHTEIGWNGFR